MKRDNGFTLVELMVAVAVLTILITLGVPAFTEFVQNNRTTSQINEMISVLTLARSEALERGERVAVLSVGGVWADGFQIRRDGNSDGDFSDGADELLQDFLPLNSATLTVSADPLIFLPSGRLNEAYVLTVVAYNCKQQNNRTINISLTGIINVTRNACP